MIAECFDCESLIEKARMNRYYIGVGLFMKELCIRPIDRMGKEHIFLLQ